jgi:hypothetical protein
MYFIAAQINIVGSFLAKDSSTHYVLIMFAVTWLVMYVMGLILENSQEQHERELRDFESLLLRRKR